MTNITNKNTKDGLSEHIEDKDRFNRFERPNDDFPFYNGQPSKVSGLKWCALMLMVAVGFSSLFIPLPFFASQIGQFIPAILLFAIPLLALNYIAPGQWKTLFRKTRKVDYGWMIVFAVLNLVITVIVANLLTDILGASTNQAIEGLATLTTVDQVLFFIKAAFQLLGEEVITMLPFLALLWFSTSRMGLSRKSAIIIAWFGSALMFGLIHLSSYDWNLLQCILIIGTARLVLTIPYILTKNLWVSTGAHILNDYMIFGISLLAISHPAAG